MNPALQHLKPIPAVQARFKPVLEVVDRAIEIFGRMLEQLESRGGFTKDIYVRYLSMQYHLTKGVQYPFTAIAAHQCMVGKRKLRDFLYHFALEEEPHYLLARNDVEALGERVLNCPLDTALWWAFYREKVYSRPFIRLGATCVLENLGPGVKDIGRALFAEADFITPSCMTFFEIHFHEALPHGDQIVTALTSVDLSDDEIEDCRVGAVLGATMYLRMVNWILREDPVQSCFEEVLLGEA